MSNQGVRGFYQITTTIKDNLLNDENVNTVTTGDISIVPTMKAPKKYQSLDDGEEMEI